MGQRVTREDFEHTYTDEPHATRRREILKKYPEVKTLFGPDPTVLFWVSLIVLFQVCSLHFVKDLSWPYMLLTAYCIGGTLNHSLMLAVHEISHNLVFGFRWPAANRAVGMLANLPLGFPIASTFKPYHLMHHRYLGVKGQDSDLPTDLEAKLFCTTFGKIVWIMLLPFFYGFRPMYVHQLPIATSEYVNFVVQLIFDALVVYFFNFHALLYLVLGSLMSMGLHPMSGHFIAEHYLFSKGQETYSYYGPFNWLSFNVGYHNEHHDFPFIAYTKLPKLRAMVPEYYENLHIHDSWIKVLYRFITDPTIGPNARTVREKSKIKELKNVDVLVEKWEIDVNGIADKTGVPKYESESTEENIVANGYAIPKANGVANGHIVPKTNGVANGHAIPKANGVANGHIVPKANGIVNGHAKPESNGVTRNYATNGLANGPFTEISKKRD